MEQKEVVLAGVPTATATNSAARKGERILNLECTERKRE
jgi:hypothetical protein